jgi:hypothetical protein
MRVLIMMSVLAAASQASALCRWFGTQLECGSGATRVVIGTQTALEPTYLRSFPIQALHGDSGLREDRATPGRPLAIDVQNVGADPSLCRTIGNETYCH